MTSVKPGSVPQNLTGQLPGARRPAAVPHHHNDGVARLDVPGHGIVE